MGAVNNTSYHQYLFTQEQSVWTSQICFTSDFHTSAACRISNLLFCPEKWRQQRKEDGCSHISLEVASWCWFSVGSFRARWIAAISVELLGISSGIQPFHNFRGNWNISRRALLVSSAPGILHWLERPMNCVCLSTSVRQLPVSAWQKHQGRCFCPWICSAHGGAPQRPQ